jgi:hypothetical protein
VRAGHYIPVALLDSQIATLEPWRRTRWRSLWSSARPPANDAVAVIQRLVLIRQAGVGTAEKTNYRETLMPGFVEVSEGCDTVATSGDVFPLHFCDGD